MSDEHPTDPETGAAGDGATGAVPPPPFDAGAADEAPEAINARIGDAERSLSAAAEAAATAERRAVAEIKALEADLERWRTESDRVRKELELRHEEELAEERAAKERAIAAAEERLGEIETHTDGVEERVAAAERRAAEAEEALAAESARAREGAAAWLRERIDQIRREGGDR